MFKSNDYFLPFITCLGMQLILLVAILLFNDGVFTFILDDPYIHFSMAENLLNQHYGINLQEYSAASSSILWPLLMAPLTTISAIEWPVLFLNSISVLLTALFSINALRLLSSNGKIDDQKMWVVFALLALNLNVLVFTGMEHNLQILCATLVFYGMICLHVQSRVHWWFILTLALAPAVRYENLLFTAVGCLFLFYKQKYVWSVVAGATASIIILSFSYFLYNIDLEFLPTSVVVKSSGVGGFGAIVELPKFARNLILNFFSPGSFLLLVFAYLLVKKIRNGRLAPDIRMLAIIFVGAIAVHFYFGRFGWYGRYEPYISYPVSLFLICLYREQLNVLLANKSAYKRYWVLAFLLLIPYGLYIVATPKAANNIYSQHFQMHRFVTEYFKKPIAVNDIGYVSFRNDEYVLDLWGLGSLEAFNARASSKDPVWMAELTRKYQVDLAMIYKSELWFSEVPKEWVQLGIMRFKGPNVAAASTDVHFYATSSAVVADIQPLLKDFVTTLPTNVSFLFDG